MTTEDTVNIALAGNPNVGKSAIFNSLTGMRQHTGNWPGKTVARAEGEFEFHGRVIHVVDLPGTYSLAAQSPEEVIARDYILSDEPDVIVNVVDATNLERNLNLTLQILEMTDRVVVALNLVDEAAKTGIETDVGALSKALGVPVVPTVAVSGEGLDELTGVAVAVADGRTKPNPVTPDYGMVIENAITVLERMLANVGVESRTRWLAIKLLEDDPQIVDAFQQGDLGSCCARLLRPGAHPTEESLRPILETAYRLGEGMDPDAKVEIVRRRYMLADRIVHSVQNRRKGVADTLTERLDRVLTHKIWAWPIMLAMLAAVFWITIQGANYPSDLLESLTNWSVRASRSWLQGVGAPWWLTGALVDGVLMGTGTVIAVMLPPMIIFFTLFSLMEDMGFIPRVAFNMDRVMKTVGSQGKQCLICMMSFGCNVTGVLSTRIIDNEKDRLVAILTSPLVICNGRFGAGIALAIIMFQEKALVVMLAMVGISLGSVFLATFALNHTIFRKEPGGFVLELPPYRQPQWLHVIWHSLWDQTGKVMLRAIEIAAPASLIIWAMGNIPHGAPFHETLVGRLVRLMAPLGSPWHLSGEMMTALLFTLPAKEIVVPSLAMTYGLQHTLQDATQLLTGLASSWTPLTAFTFLTFYMLYMPCLVTIWATWKETRSAKWTAMSVLVPLSMAVVVTSVVFWGGRLLGFS